MMDYKKICANCVRQANIVVGLWEGIYERSLNFGDDITSPYDTIPLDDIDGGCKSINEICKEIETYDMLECRYMHITTDRLIRAFCEIIGEPYKEYYLSPSRNHFWSLEPISGRYAFTLLEMWCVVNEYEHFMKIHGSRDLIEKAVKEWHDYHQNGGKINLLHWLMGARNERLRNPWKDAEKEKPEKENKFLSVPVLCRYTRGGREYYHVSQYDYDYKQWQIDNVTHWMYIPEGGEA